MCDFRNTLSLAIPYLGLPNKAYIYTHIYRQCQYTLVVAGYYFKSSNLYF